MKYLAILLLAISLPAFAQAPVPAASFAAAVAATNGKSQLVNDLYFQLKLAQDMLSKVQGGQAQMQTALSDAQAKVASCKAF